MQSASYFSLCIHKQKKRNDDNEKMLVIEMRNLTNYGNEYVCVLVFYYGTQIPNHWEENIIKAKTHGPTNEVIDFAIKMTFSHLTLNSRNFLHIGNTLNCFFDIKVKGFLFNVIIIDCQTVFLFWIVG